MDNHSQEEGHILEGIHSHRLDHDLRACRVHDLARSDRHHEKL